MKSFVEKVCALAVLLMLGVGVGYCQKGGAAIYKAKCQACHGAKGQGDTPMGKKLGVKPFNHPNVAKLSDGEWITATKKGKGKMPAYEGKLTDDQIKDLITFIRSMK